MDFVSCFKTLLEKVCVLAQFDRAERRRHEARRVYLYSNDDPIWAKHDKHLETLIFVNLNKCFVYLFQNINIWKHEQMFRILGTWKHQHLESKTNLSWLTWKYKLLKTWIFGSLMCWYFKAHCICLCNCLCLCLFNFICLCLIHTSGLTLWERESQYF